jgi:hypothetical protein
MVQSRVFGVWLVAFGPSRAIDKYNRRFGLWLCPSWIIDKYNVLWRVALPKLDNRQIQSDFGL